MEPEPGAWEGQPARHGEGLSQSLLSVSLWLCVSEAVSDGGRDGHLAAGSPHWVGRWTWGSSCQLGQERGTKAILYPSLTPEVKLPLPPAASMLLWVGVDVQVLRPHR